VSDVGYYECGRVGCGGGGCRGGALTDGRGGGGVEVVLASKKVKAV